MLSLLSAVAASIYATTNDYLPSFAVAVYSFSLFAGFWSALQQHRSAKARIVPFNKDSWHPAGDNLVLEIESDFVLFRVEIRKENGAYEEVIGDTETSEDGRLTRVLFSAKTEERHLCGRLVIAIKARPNKAFKRTACGSRLI